MASHGVTFRRATLDDLETLRGLWRECLLPEHELEKRFTEFQLAVDDHDWILGALALRFSGLHGLVHSLALRRADPDGTLHRQLWERILGLAQQHGAIRLWTRLHGQPWNQWGFAPPDPAQRRQVPPDFGQTGETWWTLKLRDEPLKLIAAEEQLEAYLELERSKTDLMIRRGRFLKIAATTFAAVLFALALAILVLVVRRGRSSTRSLPHLSEP